MKGAVLWAAVVGAGLATFAVKLVGHLVPRHWLARPQVARVAAFVTVALLSALVAVQAATSGGRIVLDSRLAGMAAAAVALLAKAPFVVVVLVAAVVTAALRWAGLP
ncbi:MAG TPA: AzlD domain-containing protein [Cellulomonas sp.]